MTWDLGGPTASDPTESPRLHVGAGDREDSRRQLDQLEEQIGVQHDRIALLMHERNARPEDEGLKARLQQAFDELDVLQEERAARMSVYFPPRFPSPSEEELKLIREAEAILEDYEDSPTDNPPPGDPFFAKP
jgi:hypothetical protein